MSDTKQKEKLEKEVKAIEKEVKAILQSTLAMAKADRWSLYPINNIKTLLMEREEKLYLLENLDLTIT